MTAVVTHIVDSPMGEVILVYDCDTAMYLGHIVMDDGYIDDIYICTRVDRYFYNPSNYRANTLMDAKAYMARAMN